MIQHIRIKVKKSVTDDYPHRPLQKIASLGGGQKSLTVTPTLYTSDDWTSQQGPQCHYVSNWQKCEDVQERIGTLHAATKKLIQLLLGSF